MQGNQGAGQSRCRSIKVQVNQGAGQSRYRSIKVQVNQKEVSKVMSGFDNFGFDEFDGWKRASYKGKKKKKLRKKIKKIEKRLLAQRQQSSWIRLILSAVIAILPKLCEVFLSYQTTNCRQLTRRATRIMA